MKQRINMITLAVSDLKKSMEFYQNGFGWSTKGIVGTEYENGAVVIFELDKRMMLSLYERKNLAWDSQVALQPASATEFSIGYLVNSDKEVDDIIRRAKVAGATLGKPAQ